MKKILFLVSILLFISFDSYAQKFAYIDTDYILNKIPEFKQAQDKLDALSTEWQKEIETKYADVDAMYRAYQQEQVLLTEPMKNKREEAIMSKEKEAKDLQKKYFAPQEWKEFRSPDFKRILKLMNTNVFIDGRNQFNYYQMKEQGFNYSQIGVK